MGRRKKRETDESTPRPRRARKIVPPADAAPAVGEQKPEPNVTLTGFGVAPPHKEFKRPTFLDHQRSRTVAVEGRIYEYVGDEDGRRVYRDQTRY
jgi:hypothetical protein